MAGVSRNGVAGGKEVKPTKRKAADNDCDPDEVKRVKLSNARAKSAKKPDLSMFKGVPLDLLPNIFQHLFPNDLVNLCDASFIFWNALCCSSQARIWKNSREHLDVYEIPDGMNEYQWAKLLFGSRCMECGAENVKLADFHLRRRICNKCRKEKCIDARRQKTPEFSRDAFACSPVTHITGTGSKASINKVYWKADVAEQHKKLAALKKNVDLDRPGATRALEEYKISRRKLLRIIQSEASDFKEYERQWLVRAKEETVDLFQVRYDEIERRFVNLGYSAQDFPYSMKRHKLVRLKTGLTTKAWQGILDTFEEEIKAKKETREREEWVKLKVTRRETLDTVYAAHLFKDVPHILWKSMPQLHTMCMLQPFDELIMGDKSLAVTKAEFEPLMDRLDEILGAAYEEVKLRLHQHIQTATDPFLTELVSTQPFQDLQLASIVFRCSHCKSLIFGLEDIRAHDCAPADHELQVRRTFPGIRDTPRFSKEFPYTYTFEEGGAHAARMVIEALGLDPKTTTPSQLDGCDKRLYCGCRVADQRYGEAFMWRSQVTHILEKHRKDNEYMSMKHPEVVPEKYMEEIRKEEDNINTWAQCACTHCDTHLRSTRLYERRKDYVLNHLRDRQAFSQVNIFELTSSRSFSVMLFRPHGWGLISPSYLITNKSSRALTMGYHTILNKDRNPFSDRPFSQQHIEEGNLTDT